MKQITDIAAQEGHGAKHGKQGNFWRINNSLQTSFGNDDVLYKTDDQLLFSVVGQLEN